jgi:CHAT domain-containing protein/tetratricopeptide (TPR) repeat protein
MIKYIGNIVGLLALYQTIYAQPNSYQVSQDSINYLIKQAKEQRIAYEYDSAESLLLKAKQISEEIENDSLLAETWYNLGLVYDFSRRPEEALKSHYKALNLRKQSESYKLISQSYYAIGEVYSYGLHDGYEAENYYILALEMRKLLKEENKEPLARIYYNLTSANRAKGDFDLASKYADSVMYVLENTENKVLLADSYILKANVLYSQLYLDSAKKYYQYAIKIDNGLNISSKRANYYYNLANVHNLDKDNDNAICYGHKSLQIGQKLDDEEAISNAYWILGRSYLDLEMRDSAFFYLSRNLDLCKQIYKPLSEEIGTAYDDLAEFYRRYYIYDSALSFVQRALEIEFKGIDEGHLKNPERDSLTNDQKGFEILAHKGQILTDAYLDHSVPITYLELAQEAFTLAMEAFTINRKSFQEEGSQLFSLEHYYHIIEKTLECLYLLYSDQKNPKYVNQALQFMERGKAVLLMETLNEASFKNNVGLPDSLLKRERELKGLMKLARNAEDTIMTDSIAKKQNDLQEYISSDFPAYYQTNYENTKVSLAQLQDTLLSHEAVIEYFWNDSSMYALGITQDSTYLVKLDVDTSLVFQYIREVRKTPISNLDSLQAQFTKYCSLAYELYKTHCEPLFSEFDSKITKLWIVPDGALAYLPFDALLESKVEEGEKVNYHNLPYLINTFEVNYAYSAAWFLRSRDTTNVLDNPKVLAFAFADEQSSELPGSHAELVAAEATFRGEFYRGEKANKREFINNAKEFDIIHLATHGRANERNRKGSMLIFKAPSPEESDTLKVSEIYNLPLTNEVTVLSACESGVGKMQRGEGIYSLARAFAYHGSKAIVMSQWRVADKNSSDIIRKLYQNINDHSMASALHHAKLNYLKEASKYSAHPSYWAGLATIGDIKVETKNYHDNQLTILVLILIFVVFTTLYLIAKRHTIFRPH